MLIRLGLQTYVLELCYILLFSLNRQKINRYDFQVSLFEFNIHFQIQKRYHQRTFRTYWTRDYADCNRCRTYHYENLPALSI